MTCLKIFDGIVNSPSFKEKEKRIKSVYIESIRVARCTVRKTHLSTQKQYNLNISLRKVFNLKRFFITNATEKEKIFCIRKLSLNTALSFDKLIAPNNDNNLLVYSSISYKLECYIRKCQNCIDKAIPPTESVIPKKVNFY